MTAPSPPAARRPRVLHGEDDPACAELIRAALDGLCDVEWAPDGLVAMERCEQAPPDLVLLDLQLPRISGFELLKRLARSAPGRASPVVVLSGRVMQQEAAEALALGCVAFVEKPFALDHLRAVITRFTLPPTVSMT